MPASRMTAATSLLPTDRSPCTRGGSLFVSAKDALLLMCFMCFLLRTYRMSSGSSISSIVDEHGSSSPLNKAMETFTDANGEVAHNFVQQLK